MATIKSFEELQIWQKARVFSKKVFGLTTKDNFSKDWALKNQINQSSGSIMDNIAEGFERGGTKEFILFLSYAKGSAGESRSQLYRAFDREYITEAGFNELNEEALEISRMISSFMTYLKNSPIKGSKFHEPLETYGELDEDSDPNLKL
jgi:four helix bundle protein